MEETKDPDLTATAKSGLSKNRIQDFHQTL